MNLPSNLFLLISISSLGIKKLKYIITRLVFTIVSECGEVMRSVASVCVSVLSGL